RSISPSRRCYARARRALPYFGQTTGLGIGRSMRRWPGSNQLSAVSLVWPAEARLPSAAAMTSRIGADSMKLGAAADTVGPKSSPPLARKSVVPTVSVASSAIGCPSERRSSMASAPPSQRARAQLDRRQPVVERQRLEERAVGELARRQIGAQPTAVGQPDVGVRGR